MYVSLCIYVCEHVCVSLSVFVCVCVPVCLYKYICMYVRMCVYVCVILCVLGCICVRVRTCVSTCVFLCVSVSCMHVHACACVYLCVSKCVHSVCTQFACLYLCVPTCMCVHVCVCACERLSSLFCPGPAAGRDPVLCNRKAYPGLGEGWFLSPQIPAFSNSTQKATHRHGTNMALGASRGADRGGLHGACMPAVEQTPLRPEAWEMRSSRPPPLAGRTATQPPTSCDFCCWALAPLSQARPSALCASVS